MKNTHLISKLKTDQPHIQMIGLHMGLSLFSEKFSI